MGRYTGKKCRLVTMFGLTGSFFLVELIVGYVTNSMALVADSFHMLSDIAALAIAFISVKMAPKSWDKNTFGWARAEVLGALVNAVFLVALCFSITVESLKRFYEPEDIHDPQMILWVGAMGLVVNLLGLCLFHEHGHSHGGHGHSHGPKKEHIVGHGAHSHLTVLADHSDDDIAPKSKSIEDGRDHTDHAHDAGGASSQMNMRGVFLHVLADALGSVVVIISALIMWLTEWEYKYYVDPGLSLILVLLMMKSVWPLLIESALILLQTVPTHIEVDTLKRKLLENVDGVLAVHEFHVWQLTGDRIIASAHIRCLNLSEYMKVAENIKEFFHNEGIHSTTIQPEFADYHPGQDYILSEDCALSCPKAPTANQPACNASKCCPPSKSSQNTPVLDRRPASFVAKERTRTPAKMLNTSTPNRRSAPNLGAVFQNLDTSRLNQINGAKSPLTSNGFGAPIDLTAEIDLSDPEQFNDLGVTPLDSSTEHTPMFMPRTNSRVVRIISKQSNV
ncbi:uncharacterized protein LOC131878217 [Tigriopus californicus]|uniref:uncharacterized protein LOC131878217 n=1 Tax=Tigriopus californicus TaxID=6832 RepID=UPI0027DA2BF5|nr:uncharacterized protein LOC131878217 [Tigriopus californicus]